MMSNKVLIMTTARCVVRPTVQSVDSQPITAGAVMVTRDPHVEGFDIGPYVSFACLLSFIGHEHYEHDKKLNIIFCFGFGACLWHNG